MKTAAVTIAILLAVMVFAFVWTWSKRRDVDSFWDILRNPSAMRDLNQLHQDVEDAASKLSGSPIEIAKLVDYFVFEAPSERQAWSELRILAKLGIDAYPRALEILRDPSLTDQLTRLTEHENSLPEGPITRLCALFDQDDPPPPEAAVLLSSFFESDSHAVRKPVALIIGSIASRDSLPDLQRALTDKDEYVRSYALMGIERAISSGRIQQSSKSDFFEMVAGMWPGDTSFSVCDKIPLILLELDHDRAIKYLLSDQLFTIRFDPLWRILEAFKKASVKIPRGHILVIIQEVNRGLLEYPQTNVLEQALSLLGDHRKEEDLPLLERFFDHENRDVAHGATDALYRFHRYFDRIRNPWVVVEKHGWDALTVAEKHLCAIERLDSEVNNGGFAQYFFNSSGDYWRDAKEGLAAIGAKERYRLMSSAIEKFGEAGPAVDRGTRTEQLSKLVRRRSDPFNELDEAWYDLKTEQIDRSMLKYNLANLSGREKGERSDEAQE